MKEKAEEKEEQLHRHSHHYHSLLLRLCLNKSYLKFAAGCLLFFLGYAFGFLSASTSTSTPPPSSSSATVFTPVHTHTDTVAHGAAACIGQPRPPPPLHDLFRFRTECAPPIPESEIVPTLLTRIFNGTSPYSHFPPPHTAGLLRPKRLRGWGSTAPVFQTLIESLQPRVIIEVGTFLGASALHMANLTAGLGLGTAILCLDDFRGWPGFREMKLFNDMGEVNGDSILMQQFMQNVVAEGAQGRVVPVPFSTASGLAAMCEWGVYGDLVEVDAGHDFHSAWQDINMAWAVVRPGGVMFGHDYHTAADNRGVRRAVDLFARTKGLRVHPNGQHWVIFPPKP